MMRPVRASIEIAVLALMAIVIAWPALAQTLSIDQAYAGGHVVGGTAEPASGPITIYNTSYGAWAPIGRNNSMDTAGNFAVYVDPPPKAGDTILAEDAFGKQSAEIIVLEPWDPASGVPPE